MHFRILPIALAALALAPAPRTAGAQTHGIKPEYIDTSVSPCKDFYQFANGAWLQKTEIPPAYTSIGAGRELFDRNNETLQRVLVRAAADAGTTTDPNLKKLGNFYASAMDSTTADQAGVRPIQSELDRIAGLKSAADVKAEIAHLHRIGVPVAFNFGPEPDPEKSSSMIAQLMQGGLGLPERDYYTKTDAASKDVRDKYVAHVTRVLQLAGTPADRAAADAQKVLALETRLAEASLTAVELRDPKSLFHRTTVKALATSAPGMDWSAYFAALGVTTLAAKDASLDVSVPKFMAAVGVEVAKTPVADWKAYFTVQVLRSFGNTLSQPIFDEMFSFTSQLTGQKRPLPRFQRAALASDAVMGEALGQAFVATEFPPAAKARVVQMVENIQAVFRERIGKLSWMSPETRAKAELKLNAIVKKFGYPDQWRDYSALEIEAGAPLATNILHARQFEVRRQLAKIGKPVDRMEWYMTPPTVNAYYNPTVNEIVFPAGILQPPFFDPQADDAVNYGGIGMVIGHELTHGFDDEGRQYDAEGNLKEWWTAEDTKKFTALADRTVKQYDRYVAIDTLHVNGKLTLGENIADLGGVTIAYYAFQKSLEGKPKPAAIDGYTPEQRFFLGFAQAWRNKFRPEALRLRTLTDPHSPNFWRINGVVSNMPEFSKAFGCKAGDAMMTAEEGRSGIW